MQTIEFTEQRKRTAIFHRARELASGLFCLLVRVSRRASSQPINLRPSKTVPLTTSDLGRLGRRTQLLTDRQKVDAMSAQLRLENAISAARRAQLDMNRIES